MGGKKHNSTPCLGFSLGNGQCRARVPLLDLAQLCTVNEALTSEHPSPIPLPLVEIRMSAEPTTIEKHQSVGRH